MLGDKYFKATYDAKGQCVFKIVTEKEMQDLHQTVAIREHMMAALENQRMGEYGYLAGQIKNEEMSR